jgi:hypothetical protein
LKITPLVDRMLATSHQPVSWLSMVTSGPMIRTSASRKTWRVTPVFGGRLGCGGGDPDGGAVLAAVEVVVPCERCRLDGATLTARCGRRRTVSFV